MSPQGPGGGARPKEGIHGRDEGPSNRLPAWLEKLASGPNRRTRMLAVIALIPTVPLFLASVAALGIFYLAPERFDRFLSRLPGDEILRGALFFAPATLFAVGVLAALYALEAPRLPPVAAPARPGLPFAPTWLPIASGTGLLFIAFSTLVLTWVAPGRTTRLLETLPGALLTVRRLQYGSLALGILALGLIGYMIWRRGSAMRAGRATPAADDGRDLTTWARAAARLVLLPAVPLFLLSLAGLALSFADPERFAGWMERIALSDWIRLVLIFAPTSLAAILFLALMVLLAQGRPPAGEAAKVDETRSEVGVWVLVGGLSLSAGVAMGLLGAVALLFVR
ncbi:MAG: hypothetical protein ACRDHY_16800 [Anaerolineales bacterium]